jgi:hypothetical protein
MKRMKCSKIRFVLSLSGALLGSSACGQVAVSVGVKVALPALEIHTASDFYQPLAPYGRWEVVGSYGRCWIPGQVQAGWRPYDEGNWQSTDAGWYWASNEPWAWATYHYGCWDLSPQFGWYWVPQTQWAPAWVSWHSGGGNIGWAPLSPPGVRVISPQAYVFVEEAHFMEPVHRSTLVVNNSALLKKTVLMRAPTADVIEKASGRKVVSVPAQGLRRQAEAPVVAKQKAPVAMAEKKAGPPVRSQVVSEEKKTPVAQASRAKTESNNSLQPTGGKADQQPLKQDKTAQLSDKKAQRLPDPSAREKPATPAKNEPNTEDKNRGNQGKE